ncbi:hypothetical protein M9H77_29194 [Catharanthus roseus]|uniref:Uncharacterized protein n=1 Tax=Catharanthus roseus TaxID=4058 RepID=A0ACC0AI46_CATRO|nr:hypothetical protein M9H77_29194 [Catharanthus roseus]
MAVPKNYVPINWDIIKSGIFPSNYAILSIWNTTQVYRLKVEGISPLKYAFCKGSRVLDKFFPWLKLPSIPNIFKYFGYYFLFGTHMEGEKGRNLMNSLCCFAHNMANEDPNCCFVVAELSQEDPIREVIPHWRKFSWDDLWCIKRLSEIGKDEEIIDQDWIKSPVVSFVDPREF